ncbi:NADP-dependent succinate-semialdehyde dehydrogenase [soil metagenome]
MRLAKPELFREAAYLSGAWHPAGEGAFTVHNPSTGAALGKVPGLDAARIQECIRTAEQAFQEYRRLSSKQRSSILRRWGELMHSHKEDLARIMTAEQGKPLAEARGEIEYAAAYLEWFSEEAKRIYGDTISAPRTSQRITIIKQPLGVCSAITPWNFPSAMVTRKVGPALAAGCAVILKPAMQCPFSALALCVLAEEAGLPRGVLSVLTGDAESIGDALLSSRIVKKLSFTGSTAVGKRLMASAAKTVKRVSLELGGNAPFIVFDDANLDQVVAGAMASKFRNAGQTCICANRFLVHDAVYDAFVERFTTAVKRLKVGDGFEESSDIGPLIDAKAAAKVSRLVDDAIARGAHVMCGARPSEAGPLFYEPTVLTKVSNDMAIATEEIFGPVAAIQRFEDEADAIAIANATPYGLASYFYTNDLNRSLRVAEALECGIVGINEGILSTELAPFGGTKESGFGKEGSKYGIEEYCEMKYVCVGNV